MGPHRHRGDRGRATRPTTPSHVGARRFAPHAGGEWRGTGQVGVCGGAWQELFICRVEAARGPQRCASATASNDETTSWDSHLLGAPELQVGVTAEGKAVGRSRDHCPRCQGQLPPSGNGEGKRKVGQHRHLGDRGRTTRLKALSIDGALRLAPHAGGKWRGTDQVGVCGELGWSGSVAALWQRVARNVAQWPPPATRRPRA